MLGPDLRSVLGDPVKRARLAVLGAGWGSFGSLSIKLPILALNRLKSPNTRGRALKIHFAHRSAVGSALPELAGACPTLTRDRSAGVLSRAPTVGGSLNADPIPGAAGRLLPGSLVRGGRISSGQSLRRCTRVSREFIFSAGRVPLASDPPRGWKSLRPLPGGPRCRDRIGTGAALMIVMIL